MPPCLLLTRPLEDSRRFAARACAQGWRGDILIAPLLEIVLHPPSPDQMAHAQALVFTSQHAVAACAAATDRRDWPVWAVGPRTAEAARAAGFGQVHQSGGDAASLLEDLVRASPPMPVLHLRGEHVAADIVGLLQRIGQEALGLIVYAQKARALGSDARERLRNGGDIILPVFSPRSGQLLQAELSQCDLKHARLYLLAISEAAVSGMQGVAFHHTRIAERPDAEAMLVSLSALQAELEP